MEGNAAINDFTINIVNISPFTNTSQLKKKLNRFIRK